MAMRLSDGGSAHCSAHDIVFVVAIRRVDLIVDSITFRKICLQYLARGIRFFDVEGHFVDDWL